MIFNFAESLILVNYAGKHKFQGKKEQSYLSPNPALLMQGKLPVARPKIAVWHMIKWEFCRKYDLWVWIHYGPDAWKPFAGTGNLLWRRKDQVLHREGHFLRVRGQKLMEISSSPSKSEPESQVSFAAASLQYDRGFAAIKCLAEA